jgi:hypothetical protein
MSLRKYASMAGEPRRCGGRFVSQGWFLVSPRRWAIVERRPGAYGGLSLRSMRISELPVIRMRQVHSLAGARSSVSPEELCRRLCVKRLRNSWPADAAHERGIVLAASREDLVLRWTGRKAGRLRHSALADYADVTWNSARSKWRSPVGCSSASLASGTRSARCQFAGS